MIKNNYKNTVESLPTISRYYSKRYFAAKEEEKANVICENDFYGDKSTWEIFQEIKDHRRTHIRVYY